MKYLLPLLALLALSAWLTSPVWAAVTYDAVGSDTTGTTTNSWSHTIAADANLIVIVVAERDGTNPPDVVSVDVGGQAASLISGCTAEVTTNRVELWALVSPTTGARTITTTGGAGNDQMTSISLSFKGAALTNTFGTCVTATGNTDAIMDTDSISSAVGQMVLQGGSINAVTTCAADATAPVSTERAEITDGVNISSCAYTEAGVSPTVDMRVDLSTGRVWAAAGVSIRAARAGSVPTLMLD